MPEASDQLRRLRVARDTGHLPRDLGCWAVLQIEVQELGAFEVRTRELQAAGRLIPGSQWARARELERLVKEVRGLALRGEEPALNDASPRGCVARALHVDPRCPGGWRQLLRVMSAVTDPPLHGTTQAVR